MEKKIISAKDFVKEAKIILAKQEKVMETYGSQYNPHIDEDGWFDMKYLETVPHLEEKLIDHVSYDVKGNFIRPKSLQGIENNNGWIKIESEEDLPKEEGFYLVFNKIHKAIEVDYINYDNESHEERWIEFNSHYQPIEKPKPPIY